MKKVIDDMKAKMEKTLDVLNNEFRTMRAGRANPGVLDKVNVDYYGVSTPIKQLAAVNALDARTLTIQPYDAGSLKAMERAINEADIGIHPQNDGKIIRLVFPPLNEERRKELAKDVHKMGEESKVAVRSIRRDAVDKLKTMKKNSDITEDDLKQGEKKIQDATDKYCKQIDTMCADKSKEIMEI
ncbi:MAG: ribosome recycling factor [Clostridia bacterium]|nr:ribosome recycling factor [Clostridia bacterium]MBQ1554510.1 ribosome recycling factor [Clostridia bacterium]MBQ4397313.1 ribosome recycling factor [Clostridia bacterium]